MAADNYPLHIVIRFCVSARSAPHIVLVSTFTFVRNLNMLAIIIVMLILILGLVVLRVLVLLIVLVLVIVIVVILLVVCNLVRCFWSAFASVHNQDSLSSTLAQDAPRHTHKQESAVTS